MPGIDGYELISRLKRNERWVDIPVIFLTAQEGRDKEQQAFSLGAVDYILKPISNGVVLSRVNLHMQLEMYKKRLEHMVEVKTEELLRTQDSILEMLSNMTAYRDNETGAHIKRTTFYVEAICEHLMKLQRPRYEISNNLAEDIGKSSKLHDIGKIGVPDGILLKPDRLTTEEFEIIKQHASLGGQILDDAIKNLGNYSSFLYAARDIAVSHHEWWNGTGYPHALEGEAIPLSGRIMAIADVYDALISKRPYKEPFSHEEAMRIIREASGTHFDPNIIDMCEDIFDSFEDIAAQYKDEHYEKKMLK
jgi:putative two-component system response regulator